MKKANNIVYMINRNVAISLNRFVGLFKSLILPVLLYDFTCLNAGRTYTHILQKFVSKKSSELYIVK